MFQELCAIGSLKLKSLGENLTAKVTFLPEGIKTGFVRLLNPVTNFFIAHSLNPNWFTTVGFVLSVFTAFLFGMGHLRIAGALVLLAGIFDIVDGKVARASGRVTKFGALYDSTLDRYSEVIIFFGLAFWFVDQGFLWRSVAVSIALGGSIMVSYIRARAEGLGFECKVGMMQRPERIVLLGLGAIIHDYALMAAVWIIAIFGNLTAIQRLYHVWKLDNGKLEQASATDKH